MTQLDITNAIALLEPLSHLEDYDNPEEIYHKITEEVFSYLDSYHADEVVKIREAMEAWGRELYQNYLSRISKHFQEKEYQDVIHLSENLALLATRHVTMRKSLLIYPPFAPRYYLEEFDQYLCEYLHSDVANEILDYDYMSLYLFRMRAFLALKQTEQALEALQYCLDLDPVSTKLSFMKANILKDIDLDSYLKALEQAYTYIHTPEDYFAYLSKMAIYYEKKQDTEHYQNLRSLIESANGSYVAFRSLDWNVLRQCDIPTGLSQTVLSLIKEHYQKAKTEGDCAKMQYFISILSRFYTQEEISDLLK